MASARSFLRSRLRLAAGSAAAWRSRQQSLRQASRPEAGVQAFLNLARAWETAPAERPIFIFSAGWRSGSTLLQRLVSSGEQVLIWGEAYDRSCVVQHLARSLASFSADWPQPSYYRQPDDLGDVSQRWIANLYPPPESLLAGYRALLLETFAQPARALGATRWGVKEVRFGLPEAVLLKGLFPDGRFLFIRRRLEDAYLSYRSFSQRTDWYADWPHGMAATAYSFARHWGHLTKQFDGAVAHTGGVLIDYEALVAGEVSFDRISSYTETQINASVLKKRVGTGAQRESAVLTGLERLQLAAGCRVGMARDRRNESAGRGL